jgi:hypothetical protein
VDGTEEPAKDGASRAVGGLAADGLGESVNGSGTVPVKGVMMGTSSPWREVGADGAGHRLCSRMRPSKKKLNIRLKT